MGGIALLRVGGGGVGLRVCLRIDEFLWSAEVGEAGRRLWEGEVVRKVVREVGCGHRGRVDLAA